MRFRNLLALPFFFAAAACGSLASHTDGPTTLATIHGEVTNPSSVPVGNGGFRVAIVWSALQEGGGTIAHVAQETAVTPVFPAQFALDVNELPPADAVSSANNVNARLAFGTLVAYEDVNGNGKLDLVDFNATSFIDRIVAARPELTIIYLETLPTDADAVQKMKDDNGASPSLGFNFYFLDACNFDGSCPASKPDFTWLPLTAPITLAMSADPQLSSLMCATEAGSSTASGGGAVSTPGTYPSMFPAKDDPNVHCSVDRRSYTYQTCVDSRRGLCGEASRSCSGATYTVPPGDNPPAGWPCGQ